MKTIGVFFGSRAPEHDVSIVTGQLIISGLKELGYKVIPVYITKKGEWLIDNKLSAIETFRKGKIDVGKWANYNLDLDASKEKLVFRKKGVFGKEITVDIVFPAFHGQNGEDGTFQGLCEMLNVPYVGCDTTASAVAMDKILTKLLYVAQKIPTTKFVQVTSKAWEENRSSILKEIKNLKIPLIIKPTRLGSSIGISKATNTKELEFAIEVALHYDPKVVVEEVVENLMDITCCVIGNDDLIPSLLQESVFQSDFFSYEDKYIKEGGAQLGRAQQSLVIPARLDEKTTKEIRAAAIEIYRLIGCSGIARVDFLFDKKAKRWFANEINTLPGTLYHHLWKKSGLEFGELLKRLIGYAEEKFRVKKNITYTFESSILTQASSNKLSLKGV
ncbi:hypothetical protein A2970_01315 [Candidatus Roizmanbacteria bacterium RIFCSPLOWO2_01_FULL_44_13]|uniref:D-alanine--D-alanine ligase n=1 Tax=Candidatus Roizmanbacteria bacterium RIFCSPLOWO2_01_FULL_44_13 TaxID=1802069 RepID=A0A1F7JB40_9BACT|nr:MAG: hypothetical protein A2970_01315 [Candidatus Roizmanbacteria bacterium RIFCSPLOWO2_01_FULL_44_13]